MTRFRSFAFLAMVLVGCQRGVPEAEYQSVVRENVRLARQVEDLTQGPTATLQRAKTNLTTGDFRGAKTEAERLLRDFPASPEAAEAPAVMAQADVGLAEATRDAKQPALTVELSKKTGLLGAPLPVGAKLTERTAADPEFSRDATETYTVPAPPAAVFAFYDRELKRLGWAPWGASVPGRKSFFVEKGAVRIAVLVSEEKSAPNATSLTIMGKRR